MSLRFGTDGVRGLAVAQLTPGYVLDLGRAAARALGGDRLLLGRDTRRSGPLLEAALAAGAAAEGMTVERLGVLPTPALASLSAREGVPAAMITASHNPFGDNGVKLFAAGGRKLSDEVEQSVEHGLENLDAPHLMGAAVGTVIDRGDAIAAYSDHVTALFHDGLLAGHRVVIDCANGAMSVVAPTIMRRLGADVLVINAAPDGLNINDGCGATSPGPLARAVRDHDAEVGLAFDGDGDRMIAVDGTGAVVDGDRLLALSALDLRARDALAHDTVVVTVMTNLGFHRAMASHGVRVVQTPVGDRYVLEAMEEGGYSLGGEQSGHVVYGDLATTGDGLLAGLVLLDLVRRSGRPLAELAAEVMTTYPQVLLNVHVARRGLAVGEVLAEEIAAAEAELHGDGRVLVRASGTEPLVRVMVEAATHDVALATAEHLADAVRCRLG